MFSCHNCRFPYFLPCLCISLFSVGALIACFWLPVSKQKSFMIFNFCHRLSQMCIILHFFLFLITQLEKDVLVLFIWDFLLLFQSWHLINRAIRYYWMLLLITWQGRVYLQCTSTSGWHFKLTTILFALIWLVVCWSSEILLL